MPKPLNAIKAALQEHIVSLADATAHVCLGSEATGRLSPPDDRSQAPLWMQKSYDDLAHWYEEEAPDKLCSDFSFDIRKVESESPLLLVAREVRGLPEPGPAACILRPLSTLHLCTGLGLL